MAMFNRLSVFRNLRISNSSFSTSCTFNSKWRKEQGLEEDPRQFSPLTNLPDYSFVDGRPTPLSFRQLNKRKHQETLCKRIVELSHELDVGLELYNEKMRQKKIERETIIKNKLKPKGAALLKNNQKQSNS